MSSHTKTDFVLPPADAAERALITDRFVALQAAAAGGAVVLAGDADAAELRIAPLKPGQALSAAPQGATLKFDADGACTISTAGMVITEAQVIQFVDGGVFATTSDARLKTDVKPIAPAAALSTVQRLEPVRYEWADGRPTMAPGQPEVGLIAQSVREVCAGVVSESRDGTLSVAYDRLTAVLTGSLQELLRTVLETRADLAVLTGRLSSNSAAVEGVVSTVAGLEAAALRPCT